MSSSEFRKDPLNGDLVVISNARSKRPTDFGETCAKDVGIPEGGGPKLDKNCPFCPGNEDKTPPEISRTGSAVRTEWTTRSFNNLFPFVDEEQKDADVNEERDHRTWSGKCLARRAGFGKHEILVLNPDHSKSPLTYSATEWVEIITALKARFADLKGKFSHSMAFLNYGKAAGASLAHPHMQIVSIDFAPPGTARKCKGFAEFASKTGGQCVLCDLIETERGGDRTVIEDDPDFFVHCPWASKYHFETWIIPRTHVKSLEEVDTEALARILEKTFSKYRHGVCEVFPFNMCIHGIRQEDSSQDFHFHIEIMPKLAKFAGLEKGWLVFGNSLCPEEAASRLRGEE